MMSPHGRRIALLLALSMSVGVAYDARAFEPVEFSPNVVDATGTLTPAQVTALNAHIQTLRERADVQAAIYLVSTTGDASIEEAAEITFERWALGEAGRDNGVLLLFAFEDRRARIETGYGLEADITDLHARRILDDVILPSFKTGAYDEGLTAGLFALGYVKTKDEWFLRPAPGIDLSAEALDAEFSDAASSDEFDVARGFRYWGVWVALLWVLPVVFRLVTYRANRDTVPRGKRLRYLLHVDGAWAVKIFLTINPGIFIFLSPLFIDQLSAALRPVGAVVEGRAQPERWAGWALAVFFAPVVARGVGYTLGRRRPNPNPVFRLSRTKTLQYVFAVETLASFVARLVVAALVGLVLAAAPVAARSLELTTLLPVGGALVLVSWLAIQWLWVVGPLVSARTWRRDQARMRLFRIQNRVKQSRPIFGKLYTYQAPSSSGGSYGSSGSSSSFSSSSGGGRSGGGGASSSW